MKSMPMPTASSSPGDYGAMTQVEFSEDGPLIEAAKADSRKFEPLYTKYYERILRFVYKRLDGKQEAYDLASQVFLNAMQNLHKYEDRGLPFSSWLYRIAINELNQYFRRSKRYRAVNVETEGFSNMLSEASVAERKTDHSFLAKAMTRLSSMDYLMLEMRFFEDRPFKEIAEILEITENNAKVRTYRAMDRLKKLLQ